MIINEFMKFPRLATPQTLISTIRTMVYGTLGAAFALSDAEAQKMVDAAVLGGVLADYITWLICSVALLPRYLLHGCYECLINLAFAWFFFRHMQFDTESDPESLAIFFLAFMAVIGIKIIFYLIDYIANIAV